MQRDLKSIVISILLLASTQSQGQIIIIADTIAFDCRDGHSMRAKMDSFIITYQTEYEQSNFYADDEDGCLPFGDIDFEKNILVGHRYRGSGCDQGIEWTAVFEREDTHVIQFSTWPPQVCRDLVARIAWFTLNKPSNAMAIEFERVFLTEDTR